MEKTIQFDVADDQYRMTWFEDDSVTVEHADQFSESFDFFDEFFQAYAGIDSPVFTMIVDAHAEQNPLSYEPDAKIIKQALKTQLIKNIKSEAKDLYFNRTDGTKGASYVIISLYHVCPHGMDIEEAKRIVRLKSFNKMIFGACGYEISVDINEIMK